MPLRMSLLSGAACYSLNIKESAAFCRTMVTGTAAVSDDMPCSVLFFKSEPSAVEEDEQDEEDAGSTMEGRLKQRRLSYRSVSYRKLIQKGTGRDRTLIPALRRKVADNGDNSRGSRGSHAPKR